MSAMRPMQRILHRNDAQIGFAVAHRFDGVFECRARHGHRMRQRFARGEIGIGAGLALEGDALGARDQRLMLMTASLLIRQRQAARFCKIGGSIDTQRHAVHARHRDGHAGFERAQLFELFALLQRQTAAAQRNAASAARVKGIDADVVKQRRHRRTARVRA